MKLTSLPLLFLILLFSCEKSGFSYSELEMADVKMESHAIPATQRQVTPPEAESSFPQRKLIKDGNISLKAEDISKAKEKMDAIVQQHGGEYGSENYEQLHASYRYRLRIDIPTENFDQLVIAIESKFNQLENKNIKVRDITEEYLDLETRLESKEAYLKRYREILTKAENVEEILQVEAQIRQIEEEIESVKGKLKFLGHRAATGHLTVVITEEIIVAHADAGDGFILNLRKSFLSGWSFMVGFFYVMVRLWPLWVFVTLSLFIYARVKKNKVSS